MGQYVHKVLHKWKKYVKEELVFILQSYLASWYYQSFIANWYTKLLL